jgi:enoyl-CoA hydratase/carnithine racemase
MFAEGFELIEAIEEAPFPVIAAVQGLCLAAGLEIALACDLIVAAEGTQFAQVEAKIGAATFLGGAYRIAQRAGTARAFEITFSGEYFDAATFERWNIVNRVVPAGTRWGCSGSQARCRPHGRARGHQEVIRHATDQGARIDRYLLTRRRRCFATRDLQHAVNLLVAQGRGSRRPPRRSGFRGSPMSHVFRHLSDPRQTALITGCTPSPSDT